MATLHVALARVSSRADTGMTLPVLESVPLAAETLTPGASSALSTLTASDQDVWELTASGGNAWVAFGPDTPDAGATLRRLVLDGQTREFPATTSLERLAYKTAS